MPASGRSAPELSLTEWFARLGSSPWLAAAGGAAFATLLLRFAGDSRRQRAAWIGLFLVGGALALTGAGFDGYDSDVWTYALILERVADGQDLRQVEPFLLEPPPSPHVTSLWLVLGHVRRLTGLPALALLRALGVVSWLLLSVAAWLLLRRLGSSPRTTLAGFAIFWLAFPEPWGAVAQGRSLAFGLSLLAAAMLASPPTSPRTTLLAGVLLALVFHVHLFSGLLGLALAALVLVARWRWRQPPRAREAGLLALPLLLAAPAVRDALAAATLEPLGTHVWRPDQVEALGLRWLDPLALLQWFPPALIVLLLVGLVARGTAEAQRARTLGRLGLALALALVLTPLFHVLLQRFGGFMVPRLLALALPWLGAALGWAACEKRPLLRGLAWSAVAVLAGQRLLTLEGELRGDAYLPFRPAVQREARELRPLLRQRVYISLPDVAYGLAAPTLGRPFAVPPGHASPFSNFGRRRRRLGAALSANTVRCWSAFLAFHPEVEYLVSPGPQALVERRLWLDGLGAPPEEVRQRLRSLGALSEVRAGAFFVVDALTPPRGGPPPGQLADYCESAGEARAALSAAPRAASRDRGGSG